MNVVEARRSAVLLALSCLPWATGCDEAPSGPTVPLTVPFTLAPGQSASIADASLSVQFVRVSSDSRCPADVVCIQAGDAVVQVRVTGGGTVDYELHTNDQTRSSVAHGAVRIELVRLEPYPFSNSAIDPASYRATLVLTP